MKIKIRIRTRIRRKIRINRINSSRIRISNNSRMENYRDKDFRYGAPVLVLVTNQKESTTCVQDASCAMENMMLAAFSLGVGSCWINQLYRTREDREVQEKLAEIGVTPEEMPVAALALGWPAVDFPGPREKTGNLVSWVR